MPPKEAEAQPAAASSGARGGAVDANGGPIQLENVSHRGAMDEVERVVKWNDGRRFSADDRAHTYRRSSVTF